MSTNHEHTPTTEEVRLAHAESVTLHKMEEPELAVANNMFDRWYKKVIAAAEQRGAVRALREAATRLRDSRFANSVKPPHEKVQVPESDWLERRADRLEGDDEAH